ncbi:MAG: hypothetical protein ACYC9S_08975 [Leptospirales bacterium]
MSESREKHRLRMQLKRSHPDWSSEQIRHELQKFTGSQGSQIPGSQKKNGNLVAVNGSYVQYAPDSQKRVWAAQCPVNPGERITIDPERSFRPMNRCEHFQQLEVPGTASRFLFKREGSLDKSSQTVHKSSQSAGETHTVAVSLKGSQEVHKSSLEQRVWLKFDHAVDKSQYVLSESLDGVTWRYVSTLTKNQALERNGLVLVHTWHKGSTKEDDAV